MPIPIINRTIVGVKEPDSKRGAGLELGEAIAMGDGETIGLGLNIGEGDGDGDGDGEGDVEGVMEAEGVDSKAGPSAACTTKFLTKVLVTPSLSFQVSVSLWEPFVRLVGGDHFQRPLASTFTLSVTTSDSSVTEIVLPSGPWPKNSGSVVVTISP